MDPTHARRLRIDRRDGGMRRQRRVTQWTAAAAVAAAIAFGWVFAHGTTASADTSPPTGTSGTTSDSTDNQSGSGSSGGSGLQQPDQAPGWSGSTHSDTRSGGS